MSDKDNNSMTGMDNVSMASADDGKKKSSDIGGMLKDTAILLVITLISGLLLGLVYQITKEPIAIQKEKAKQEACQEVFAGASFKELECVQPDAAMWEEAGFKDVTVDEVMLAYDSDELQVYGYVDVDYDEWMMMGEAALPGVLGYVITVTTKEGYGGDISFMIGIRTDGTVNGISILSISETAGLGMRAEEVLKPQFAGKNVEKFEYTKSGAASDSQIDAISGATITTNAVTNGVNAGLYYFQTQLKGGSGNE